MTPADDQPEFIAPPRQPPLEIAYPATEEAHREAVRVGLDDLEAGRTVSAGAVRRWIESWGSDDELPMPEPD